MKASEEKLRERVNSLGEQIEELRRTRTAAVTAWEQTRIARLRAGEEPDQTFPALDVHELTRAQNKERIARDVLREEPAHQQKLREVNELNAA
jgi:hypothetical protein